MSEITVQDGSHGLLVALLMSLGGSHVLPLSAFPLDALGHIDGTPYTVRVDPVGDGEHVRLVVVADAGHAQPQAD